MAPDLTEAADMSDSQTGQRPAEPARSLPSSPPCAPWSVFLLAALLTSIFQRKQEAKNPYVRLVEVNEETTDPGRLGHELGA